MGCPQTRSPSDFQILAMKIESHWANLNAILTRWRVRGARTTAFGAELICHVPHIAPEAWLHELHAPLTEPQLCSLEARLERAIPRDIRRFFRFRANGLHLFSDSYSVHGRRWSLERIGDAAIQPYCIASTNDPRERFRGCPPEFFFFGSYSEDGSRMAYPDPSKSDEVWRVNRETGHKIAEWPDFWTWLVREATHYSALYDDCGRLVV